MRNSYSRKAHGQMSRASDSTAPRVRNLMTDRRGIALPMAAVLFALLLAFMGLVLDGGRIYFEKRAMQTAADAGAMAGAHELWRQRTDLSTQVRPAAVRDTELNSYTDANSIIAVNVPPASGPRAGDNNFVEVIIEHDVPAYFMRILNWNQVKVRARAVAGLLNYSEACVFALDPSVDDALRVAGNASLNSNCGVMVNSNHPEAIRTTGGGCLSATWIGTSGSYDGYCYTPTPTTDVPPMMDPLAHIPVPDTTVPIVATNYKVTGGTATMIPGRYYGGIEITGGLVTVTPGIYIIDRGGMKVTGGTIVMGPPSGGYDGVMFYNTNLTGGTGQWGFFDIAGNATVQLYANTTGDYAGVLFFSDRNMPDKSPGHLIRGDSASIFEGAIYSKSTHLDYAGTSTVSNWTMIVGNTIDLTGGALVNNNFGASPVPIPVRKVTLVE